METRPGEMVHGSMLAAQGRKGNRDTELDGDAGRGELAAQEGETRNKPIQHYERVTVQFTRKATPAVYIWLDNGQNATFDTRIQIPAGTYLT